MATVSSHFLNGVDGTHAAHVGVKLVHLSGDGARQIVFTAHSDDGGRFSHEVETTAGDSYELVIASGAYFQQQSLPRDKAQILEEIVIRFSMPDPVARYHIPVIMSPNSYSCWWSS
jgi:5-hydroxyisourate hydrolase